MDRVIQTLESAKTLRSGTHSHADSWRWADVVRRPEHVEKRESMRALSTRPTKIRRPFRGVKPPTSTRTESMPLKVLR
jgi:hypothetical protein